MAVQVALVICGIFICEFSYMQLKNGLFSGTYLLIYSDCWSFYMQNHYIWAYFWSPFLLHITRSTCTQNFYLTKPYLTLPNAFSITYHNPNGGYITYPRPAGGHITLVFNPDTCFQITDFESNQNLVNNILGPLKLTSTWKSNYFRERDLHWAL